jgi:hypothetical protein
VNIPETVVLIGAGGATAGGFVEVDGIVFAPIGGATAGGNAFTVDVSSRVDHLPTRAAVVSPDVAAALKSGKRLVVIEQRQTLADLEKIGVVIELSDNGRTATIDDYRTFVMVDYG